MTDKIDIRSSQMFHDLTTWQQDQEMQDVVLACIIKQKEVVALNARETFHPDSGAQEHVSAEALEAILAQGQDISDIRTHKDITNCIVFHTKNLQGSLLDDQIFALRKKADEIVIDRVRSLFAQPEALHIEVSGHFWYPAQGFMGWHTNLRKPGWRLYVNYAEEEGRSFFRYRDPDSGEIVTCPDKRWNFRLFKIAPEKPFWHCVYSDTNRFSLGYKIDIQ